MKTPIKFLTENENPSRQLSITDGHKRFFCTQRAVNWSIYDYIYLHLFLKRLTFWNMVEIDQNVIFQIWPNPPIPIFFLNFYNK